MLKSAALIESYLDELIEKAVGMSMDYTNILKAIDFTAKEWRAIDKESKKIWNAGGRKRFLSSIIQDILSEKYPDEKIENLIFPDMGRTSEERDIDAFQDQDNPKDKSARDRQQQYVSAQGAQEPATPFQDKPFDIERDALTGTSDALRLKQFQDFGNKLIDDANKRASSKRGKEILEYRSKTKTETDKRNKKEAAKRKLKRSLRGEVKDSVGEGLWNEYLKVAPSDITFKLVNLIGSASDKPLTSARIKKFIDEVIPRPYSKAHSDAANKLLEIAEALDKETDASAKGRLQDSAGRTTTALTAKTNGNAVGSMSTKSNRGRVTPRWGKDSSERLSASFTKNQSNELLAPKFVKLDITNNTWFTQGAGTLLPIVEAHLEIAGYTLQDWENGDDKKKQEIATKLNRMKTPKYLEPTNLLTIMYDRVWGQVKDKESYENPPIDFAYWLEGYTQGLSGQKASLGVSVLQALVRIENRILPALIKAIEEGVVLDPESKKISVVGIQRRYNRAIKSIPEDVRNESLVMMFRIMNGDSYSSKFKGKNKQILQDAEGSIRNQINSDIQGKPIFEYLLEAHLEFNRSNKVRSIISDILVERTDDLGEPPIEFVSANEAPKKDDNWEPQKNITRTKKRKLIPLMRRNEKGRMVKVKRDDGSVIMVDEPSKPNNPAGKKTREFVDRETARLKRIKNTDGKRKYSDDEIWQLVGWKKVKQEYQQRDSTNSPTGKTKEKDNYVKFSNETKKSLENLLDYLGESDNIIIKEDTGLILESLNKTQKKKLKTILNVADPTEYFGHDFLKLADVIEVLKSLGVVKGDKQLGKKVIKLEDKNLKVVKLATRLRKDYENLYSSLRKLIYPKTGVDEK